MTQYKNFTLGFVGGGKGGLELLNILARSSFVHVDYVCDIDPGAPAMVRARELGVRTLPDLDTALARETDFIIEATGKKSIQEILYARTRTQKTRVISNEIAFFLFEVFEGNARALSESERNLLNTIEFLPDATFVIDKAGKVTYWNRAMERLSGSKAAEMVGQGDFAYAIPFYGKRRPMLIDLVLHPDPEIAALYKSFKQEKDIITSELHSEMADNKKGKYLYGTAAPLYDSSGAVTGAIESLRDITEHKNAEGKEKAMEQQLLQAQKMESVGRLAGGVAHDFNNLLTAIGGYAGFVLNGLNENDPMKEDVKEILIAADRAAALTKQLLAFSRKQLLAPKVIDLNVAVGGMVKMLKRLIGEDIRLEACLEARPCRVKVDAGQIDQVIANLVVNARDAMPGGGALTLSTRLITAEESRSLKFSDMAGMPLVCLSVRDTGSGFTAEAKAHLFEPFFTTKEKGKGTGLGLSMVFGIIKQSGGEIDMKSSPGSGTTFEIFFPNVGTATPDKEADREKDAAAEPASRAGATILLVEDEDSLRRLGERLLKMDGYAVTSAADGKSALEAAERHGRPFDLLMTDVVMPGMSGQELARELASRNLAHRTLYTSGYTEDAIQKHGVLDPGIAFIYKPFTAEALFAKLREVLGGPADKAKA
ncbi:MAG: ATP-binding protein [Elusimicrobiales bacterium]|nr:ATP-binding protein [Elusimicrobiales bacterium]